MKINAYGDGIMRVHDDGCGQKHRSWQRFLVLASNSNHYHPANGVFNTNILLSHAVCPSLCRYGLVTVKLNKEEIASEVEHMYRLHISHAPGLVAVTKFKTTKINSEGLL